MQTYLEKLPSNRCEPRYWPCSGVISGLQGVKVAVNYCNDEAAGQAAVDEIEKTACHSRQRRHDGESRC